MSNASAQYVEAYRLALSGRHAQALDLLDRLQASLKDAGEDWTARVWREAEDLRARIWWEQGEREKAVQVWKQMQERVPRDRMAAAALTAIEQEVQGRQPIPAADATPRLKAQDLPWDERLAVWGREFLKTLGKAFGDSICLLVGGFLLLFMWVVKAACAGARWLVSTARIGFQKVKKNHAKTEGNS